MRLKIESNLYYQVHDETTFLFAIRCRESAFQKILSESISTTNNVEPTELVLGMNENLFTSVRVKEPGEFTLSYRVEVETDYQIEEVSLPGFDCASDFGPDEMPYVFPSRYAPADRLRNAAFDLFGDCRNPFDLAVAVEEWVHQNIRYQTGSSTEHSSAIDTFVNRAGVCRDFAHLGIAFCRALNIPARYVSGYSPDLVPLDFHAVYEVFFGGDWYLFDATRQVPLNRFARIATGKDAGEVATASLFGRVSSCGISVFAEAAPTDESVPDIEPNALREGGKAIRIS